MDIDEASATGSAVLDELSGAIIAEESFFERLLVGILARGHVLLEDVPGTGKTLTARCLAQALGLSFSRIQFTPDLLPADVTGTHIYDEDEGEFSFAAGPVFANIVLADEINRAPPKTQSALLESMEERQVTVGGETHDLPEPFFVIATQNPVDMEGTFALPEAQVDRFLLRTAIGYPDEDGEVELLRRRQDRTALSPDVEEVIDSTTIDDWRSVPETVHVDDDLLKYMAAVTRHTRTHHETDLGVSPRGTQRLFEAARACAVLQNRAYVTPADVKKLAPAVLEHRVVLTANAQVDGASKAGVVADALEQVPVPTV